jgi:hypothetical protein
VLSRNFLKAPGGGRWVNGAHGFYCRVSSRFSYPILGIWEGGPAEFPQGVSSCVPFERQLGVLQLWTNANSLAYRPILPRCYFMKMKIGGREQKSPWPGGWGIVFCAVSRMRNENQIEASIQCP